MALYYLHLLILHAALVVAILNWTLAWFLVSVVAFLILQLLAGNVALHRYFAHRSFETGHWRDRLLLLLGNLTALGSSLSWVLTHQHHHRFADQPEDCHSPNHLPLWKILLGKWNPVATPGALLRALPDRERHLFFHRYYYALHYGLITLLLIVNWKILVFAYAVPNLMVYYALYSVVILCHRSGYRNFSISDRAFNHVGVALITLGEGWHNNHHAFPQRHRNTHHWWEWDPTARISEIFFAREKTT